jgi:hypothetical protein
MYILLVVGCAIGGKRKVVEVEQLYNQLVTLVAEFERPEVREFTSNVIYM